MIKPGENEHENSNGLDWIGGFLGRDFTLFLCRLSSWQITGLRVRSDVLVWVDLEGTHTGKPTCATGNYWMIKDENSEYGKKQYSMLLAAYLSGKTFYIDGDNLCTRWFDGENIKTLAF